MNRHGLASNVRTAIFRAAVAMLLQRTVPIGASTGERICGNGLEEEPTGYAAPKTHLIFGFRIVMVPLISNRLRGLTRPIDGARTVAIWWGVECETECHHRRVRQIYFTPRSRTTKWKLATNARIQQRLVNQSDSGGRAAQLAQIYLCRRVQTMIHSETFYIRSLLCRSKT